MDLAIVIGRDPAALANLEGKAPLVKEEDVVAYGFRDAESAAEYGSPDVRGTSITLFDLEEVRRLGPAAAARNGLAGLEGAGVDGFWIHLDADVLNDEVMPAVDYRMPDGLWPEELSEALTVFLASPLSVGMDVTIYNPAFDDQELSAGRALAQVIIGAFAAAT